MNNVSLKAAAELMGHSDVKTTARYSHLGLQYQQQAIAQLPALGAALPAA